MQKKNLTILAIMMLLLLTLTSIFPASFKPLTLAQETRLYVDPASLLGLEIGNTFQINITISNVIDLYAWQFSLYYLNDILNATNIVEGPFLKAHPDTDETIFSAYIFTDTYNATHGLILAASTLSGVHGGVSGNGVLATITFKVMAEGDSPLSLRETKLVDSVEPFGNLIPHTVTDGIVHVGLHDVAIINTKTSKTITGGSIVYVNVTVENQGQTTETFDVTVYYNSTPIETKTVTNLDVGTTIMLTFQWNTTTVPKGNYTISASATIIEGETDTADNTYIDGWVFKTILGDVNGDRKVNIIDITLVAVAFKTTPTDPKWNPNADINNDNTINILDISKVAKEFGKTDP